MKETPSLRASFTDPETSSGSRGLLAEQMLFAFALLTNRSLQKRYFYLFIYIYFNMKTLSTKLSAVIVLLLLSCCFLHSAIHIVTTENNDGPGSLRQLIKDAAAGDTIAFAQHVKRIVLERTEVVQQQNQTFTLTVLQITRNLTIIGGVDDDRVIIDGNNSIMFQISGTNTTLYISNVIMQNCGALTGADL